MNESPALPVQQFRFPDIRRETGEFERVGQTYNQDPELLIQVAESSGKLTELSEDLWSQLGNTDSHDLNVGDWDLVQHHSEGQDVVRDWQSLKHTLKQGGDIEAPIIMKYADEYHLVSGNTRLMVARALGIRPQVLLFEVNEKQ